MNREQAVSVIAKYRSDAAVVMGPGASCGLIYEKADAPRDHLQHGHGIRDRRRIGRRAGSAAPPGAGDRGRRIFLRGLHNSFDDLARAATSNLVVVVLDNGVWGTGDGLEPTATAFGTDLVKLALAVGWNEEHVQAGSDPAALEQALTRSFAGAGPHFIVGKTDPAADTHLASGARPRARSGICLSARS